MMVILKENVTHLGLVGDLVKVSDGYARNYLLPHKLVVVANEKNVKELQHHKRILDKKRIAQKAKIEEFAKVIGEYACTISRKVGRNEKLFGSVTTQDIASNLKKAGYDVDKTAIQLKDPIKTLGVHPVTIKFKHDVSATLKVWVVKEEGSEASSKE